MLKRHEKVLLLFLLITIISSGCITDDSVQSEEVTGSFNVSSGTVVRIYDVNGPIEVNVWKGDTVEMIAQKRAYIGGKEELSKVQVIVTENDRELRIETDYPIHGTAGVLVEMQLKVPQGVPVKVLETTD